MEKEMIRFEKFNLPIKLHHLYMEQGGAYRGMHAHLAVEVVWVKSGSLCCQVNEETVWVQPGEVLLINSNTGHRLSAQKAEIYYLHVDVGLLEEKPDAEEMSALVAFISYTRARPWLLLKENREILSILQKINEKYDEEAESARWYMKAYLYELLAFMYAQSFITPITVDKEQIKKIEPVVRYVNANFKSALTLAEICGAAKYSTYTVCHTFKAVTGGGVFEYIQFLRVCYAVSKLRDPKNSILDIAVDCGFSSASYFNRVFKNFYGCSPSVYRKRLPKTGI